MKGMAINKKEARRDHILDAAERVFGEMGYHRASVLDILAGAGIARGTFYLHFDSKRQVFDDLLDAMIARLREQIVDVNLADPHKTMVVQLQDNVARVLTLLFEERAMARILLTETGGVDADLDRKLKGFYDGILQLIAETLQLGQRAGIVRACDTHLVASCILGSIKELVYQHVLRDRPASDISHVAGEILAYNLQGIFAQAPRK